MEGEVGERMGAQEEARGDGIAGTHKLLGYILGGAIHLPLLLLGHENLKEGERISKSMTPKLLLA